MGGAERRGRNGSQIGRWSRQVADRAGGRDRWRYVVGGKRSVEAGGEWGWSQIVAGGRDRRVGSGDSCRQSQTGRCTSRPLSLHANLAQEDSDDGYRSSHAMQLLC